MTRTGDREIRSVSGRLPDNPGELACMCLRVGFLRMAAILTIDYRFRTPSLELKCLEPSCGAQSNIERD